MAAWFLLLVGQLPQEEGSRAQQAWKATNRGGLRLLRSPEQAGRPWLRPRPCYCPFFPVLLAFSRREKQQKVVVLRSLAGFLPSRRLNRSLGVCSLRSPEFLLRTYALRAGLSGPECRAGCPHGLPCGPDMGTSQGSSAALDSDLASPYRKRRGDR